jgi:hypothetical protein
VIAAESARRKQRGVSSYSGVRQRVPPSPAKPPLRLRVDDRSRPHAEDGPSIAYSDGLERWAPHGVVVPTWLVREPERLDVEAVTTERNSEVRRIMVERYGMGRLVRDGGAELVHEDDRGRLWRIDGRPRARRAPLVMIEVVNSTPEPDGTYKRYLLRVPSRMRTAGAAVGWTFGLRAHEYAPEQET